ncbi:ankyrin repeat protein with zinc finger domain RING-type [Fadolivirus algeromassiliense]|jgi:hypothetical protein|uniref:Ankyrin repeat protein with zinc finger domain RING-type n=1 Tax=Fadolivirus FV1/VV64 TaxID=3070911 RepID=A0A7D3QTQ7_9VIRU|nr:ankyrin repeat protein with zinc finger domain RING-type [Fadolivirus algeromassiliense]QKF93503.1 ankyrin repeat protein with zinc finger domain RING-type [Fadolivirus FV1/VV64]
MSAVAKFYNFCLNENIEGLNELKKSGLILQADQRRKAVIDMINAGKLESVKWLFNNHTINLKRDKLLQQACMAKKFNVAEWLCNNSKINMTKFKEMMASKIKKDEDIKNWIEKKVKKEKIINNKFIELCKGSDIDKIDKYYFKYKHSINKDIIPDVINNNFTIEFIKWLLINKLCNNPLPLMMKSLMEDKLSVFKWFYRTLMIKITEIVNYEKMIDVIDKNTDTYKYVIECIDDEKIYGELLKLCEKGNMTDIQMYYLDNLKQITNQIISNGIGEILSSSTKNIEVFKWFFKLYKVEYDVLKIFLYDAIPEGNKPLIDFCKNSMTPSQIRKLDIDIPLLLAHEAENYDTIQYMLDNGFKLKKHSNCIFICLLNSNNLNLLNKINDEYNCLNDIEDYEHAFITACGICKLEIVKWLYSLLNDVFEDEYDMFYEASVDESYQNENNDVLKWLIGLYGRFYLLNNPSGGTILVDSIRDDDYYDSEDEEIYNEIYDIVLENKKKAFDLLGITMTFTNQEDDDCIICKGKPDDLIKLNCGHFGCIDCLATWYKTNKEKCVYCKKDTIWPECKKLEH